MFRYLSLHDHLSTVVSEQPPKEDPLYYDYGLLFTYLFIYLARVTISI